MASSGTRSGVDLRVLYEDEEVVVMKAPHDEELVELVHEYLKRRGRPVSWKELREAFSGIAGEDRLRKALHRLREQGVLIEFRGGWYTTVDTPGVEKILAAAKVGPGKKLVLPEHLMRESN